MQILTMDEVEQVSGGIVDDIVGRQPTGTGGSSSGSSSGPEKTGWPFFCFACEN